MAKTCPFQSDEGCGQRARPTTKLFQVSCVHPSLGPHMPQAPSPSAGLSPPRRPAHLVFTILFFLGSFSLHPWTWGETLMGKG